MVSIDCLSLLVSVFIFGFWALMWLRVCELVTDLLYPKQGSSPRMLVLNTKSDSTVIITLVVSKLKLALQMQPQMKFLFRQSFL